MRSCHQARAAPTPHPPAAWMTTSTEPMWSESTVVFVRLGFSFPALLPIADLRSASLHVATSVRRSNKVSFERPCVF
jgi:hypothetical protein